MKHYEIVATLVEQGDSYCFELRTGASNGAIGLLGFFGGKIEAGETEREAACREVREESNLSPQPEDLEPIGELNVVSDRDNETITVHAQLFKLRVDPKIQVEATIGEAVTMTQQQVKSKLDGFSPVARAYFETRKD